MNNKEQYRVVNNKPETVWKQAVVVCFKKKRPRHLPRNIAETHKSPKDVGSTLGVHGRIILKWLFRKWEGGMDWIDLAQDRDRLRDLVNEVMNLRVP